ncbi:MAG: RHS repeat domain-containing protein [Vicinamibacterales bacterium]
MTRRLRAQGFGLTAPHAVRRVALRALLAFVALTVLAPSAHAQPQEVVEYYGTDALGSVRVVFDAAGNRVARTDYVPFGEALNPTGALPREQFTGQPRDGDAGLDYFGARYYAARLGRFSTIDPVGGSAADPQSWNRYVYARNAPGTFVDPTGTTPIQGCTQYIQNINANDFYCLPGGGNAGGGSTIPSVNTLPLCWASPQACAARGDSWIDDPELVYCWPTCGQLTPDPGVDTPYRPPAGGAAVEQQLASTGETNGNVTQSALQDANAGPPPIPLPPGKSGDPNSWKPGPGSSTRPVRWGPNEPIKTPTGSQPSASWDPTHNHWDYDDGFGNRSRFDPAGRPVTHERSPGLLPALGQLLFRLPFPVPIIMNPCLLDPSSCRVAPQSVGG